MNIPITSTLGFLGLISLVTGMFLFLTGLEVFKITQVTVMPGKKTWGAGLIFAIVGVALLMPDLLKNSQSSEIGSETPLPPIIPITGTVQSPTIDVPDPLGTDVLEFAATVKFDIEPKGSLQNIGGIWDSKWNWQGGNWYTGTATILVSNDNWIYIVYQDNNRGGQYVIKAKLVDNKLIGRYINVNVKSDSTPWVGIIVDDNRIDGKWKSGEWNFTRNP